MLKPLRTRGSTPCTRARSGYGAPEPQSAAQSLARVDTFVTHHQARGDLVFQERVEAARITEDLLADWSDAIAKHETLWSDISALRVQPRAV